MAGVFSSPPSAARETGLVGAGSSWVEVPPFGSDAFAGDGLEGSATESVDGAAAAGACWLWSDADLSSLPQPFFKGPTSDSYTDQKGSHSE